MNPILEELILFIFAYLFQCLIYVYSIHLFSNHKIKWKPFWACVAIIFVLTYISRLLLTIVNHTLFSLIFLIVISIIFFKIPAEKVIKIALLIAILTFIYEGAIIMISSAFMGFEKAKLFLLDTYIGQAIVGILSNIFLVIVLIPVYIYKKKKALRKGE